MNSYCSPETRWRLLCLVWRLLCAPACDRRDTRDKVAPTHIRRHVFRKAYQLGKSFPPFDVELLGELHEVFQVDALDCDGTWRLAREPTLNRRVFAIADN